MAEPRQSSNDPSETVVSVRVSDSDPHAHTHVATLQPEPPGAPGRAPQITAPLDESPPLVAGRYEILGMLGSGGMGTVYRARDRELDEIVALKLLKKELASATGMLERFRREVKLARRVTHKNVARTFDIGDHEGDRFLTMELIDGEMLGAHLARRGRVPVRDVITIARDVCAGLAAAHAAGVLHRDLKPENVILARDGRAVITDFGIARALAQAELSRTAPGMIGTPAYMAPEQVEGATDLDGRADLYALGTMLFELLTGKDAWPGDSVVAVAAGRILRPPPDVRTHAPELPASIADIVLKLMARRREDRFASADEADAALAAIATSELPSTRSLVPVPGARSTVLLGNVTPAHAPRKTVAVLPLVNLGAADDEYLAQTVTEDLVDLLSMIPALRLRPRGQTTRFDGKTRDVREAGRELGVDVVVDGSLRRVGDHVRISVRLVTVEDGFQLWARRFDRAPAEVLSVADDAASAIARALATEPALEARPAAVGDAIAQDLYLRGRYLLGRGWFEVSQDGAAMMREAYERAPDDLRIAGAYALASARVLSAGANAGAEAARARDVAERTLALDPSQAEARVALGFIHLNASEGAAAAVQLKRALAVSPNSVEALDAIARLMIEVGMTDLGIATLHRAIAIDPQMLHPRLAIARAHSLLGERDTAREMLGPPPLPAPDFTSYMLHRGRLALWYGNRDPVEIEALTRLATPDAPLTPFGRQSITTILHVARTGTLAPQILREIEEGLPLDRRFPPRRVAFHAQMRAEFKLAAGDVDGALADLRVGDTAGLLDVLWLDRCPIFDGVRHRPDFIAIRESTAVRAERVVEALRS